MFGESSLMTLTFSGNDAAFCPLILIKFALKSQAPHYSGNIIFDNILLLTKSITMSVK